jgi:hypothetical protein
MTCVSHHPWEHQQQQQQQEEEEQASSMPIHTAV